MDRKVFDGARARLRGLARTTHTKLRYVLGMSFADDYKEVLQDLARATDEDLAAFNLPVAAFESEEDGPVYVVKDELISKIDQLEPYLDTVYGSDDRVAMIGSIYKAIQDQELKDRCEDLLAAPDHFDRVVNQATQVLENGIRSMVSDQSGASGTSLVNKYIKTKIADSPIVLSDDESEQEGFAHVFRGMMGAFRNPSHHQFIENMTRETALQIAGFIDSLLGVLGSARVK